MVLLGRELWRTMTTVSPDRRTLQRHSYHFRGAPEAAHRPVPSEQGDHPVQQHRHQRLRQPLPTATNLTSSPFVCHRFGSSSAPHPDAANLRGVDSALNVGLTCGVSAAAFHFQREGLMIQDASCSTARRHKGEPSFSRPTLTPACTTAACLPTVHRFVVPW